MTLNGGILFDKSGTRVEVKDIKCNLAEPIKEKDAFIFILLFFEVCSLKLLYFGRGKIFGRFLENMLIFKTLD